MIKETKTGLETNRETISHEKNWQNALNSERIRI